MQFKPLRTGAGVLAALVLPVCAQAQARAVDTEGGSPRVERLTFEGAESLPRRDLRLAIVTDETRCRGFLLQPFCAVTDWKVLHERYYLDRAELRSDELRLRIYYFQRGYRQAEVSSRVQPRGRGVEVVFEIEEGPPTLITSMEVEQTRDVLSERQVRRAALPQAGEPLDVLRLSAGLARLQDRLGRAGHLDGEVHDTATLDVAALRAAVRVRIEPGPRSTLRAVEVTGNEDVTDRTISDALLLGRDRVLRTTDVAASQRSLYESNLFHEARVTVPEQADSAKVLHVEVREAPPRLGRVGGGFNTMEFVQLEGRYTHHNWLGRGRRIDVRGTVTNLLAGQLNDRGIFRDVLPAAPRDPAPFTRPGWQASVEFVQPAFRSAANAVGAGAFAHRRVIPAVAIDEGYGGDVSFTQRLRHRMPVTLTYRYEQVRVDAGDIYFCVNYGICELPTVAALHQRHSLSPLSLSFVSDGADNPLAPTTGHRVRADIEHASGLTLSDFQYNRISATASAYYPLDVHRRRVLAGRLRAGWVAPLDGTGAAVGLDDQFDEMLHPRKRFFAGGARSVRGFRENQLGPRVLTIDPTVLMREADCTEEAVRSGACVPAGVPATEFVPRPTGGRSVIEASVELRFPLTHSLQGAAFIDAGRVGESLGGIAAGAAAAITPGVGVRYDSPVGPIRVDLGLRPGRTQELPVITEYTDDTGERRLVPLDTPYRYNPLDGSRGFLRQVFNRLALHLAIGEAY
jgi:outer membrane protein insertion porin family